MMLSSEHMVVMYNRHSVSPILGKRAVRFFDTIEELEEFQNVIPGLLGMDPNSTAVAQLTRVEVYYRANNGDWVLRGLWNPPKSNN